MTCMTGKQVWAIDARDIEPVDSRDFDRITLLHVVDEQGRGSVRTPHEAGSWITGDDSNRKLIVRNPQDYSDVVDVHAVLKDDGKYFVRTDADDTAANNLLNLPPINHSA